MMIAQISPKAWMILHDLKCVFILNKTEYKTQCCDKDDWDINSIMSWLPWGLKAESLH